MSAIKNTKFDGDISVGRHVNIGGRFTTQGNSRVKGNLRVDGWLFADNIRVVNKGLFTTLDELRATYPKPYNGWWAIVGTSLPGQVYTGKSGEWIPTGGQGGEVDPLLSAEEIYDITEIL